jgi:hypothetical protein
MYRSTILDLAVAKRSTSGTVYNALKESDRIPLGYEAGSALD